MMMAGHEEIWVDPRCPKCGGGGQVANTQSEEPWSVWLDKPLRDAWSVVDGSVKPMDCPDCLGSGSSALGDVAIHLVRKYADGHSGNAEGQHRDSEGGRCHQCQGWNYRFNRLLALVRESARLTAGRGDEGTHG